MPSRLHAPDHQPAPRGDAPAPLFSRDEPPFEPVTYPPYGARITPGSRLHARLSSWPQPHVTGSELDIEARLRTARLRA